MSVAGQESPAPAPVELEVSFARAGWRGSRPVRIGNGACDQRQLDVYGEVLGAVHRLRAQVFPTDAVTTDFLLGIADAAADQWREPDQGRWEVGSGPRRFVHSAVMCWVALDRALRMADDLLAEEHHDPEMLGNFPQAFSHIGMANAAWSISQAERA